MQFYRVEMYLKNENAEEIEHIDIRSRNNSDKNTWKSISARCESFNEMIADKGYLFLSNACSDLYVYGMIINSSTDVEKLSADFAKEANIQAERIVTRETTLNDLSRLLRRGERDGYVFDEDDILREYGLEDLVGSGYRMIQFEEKLIRKCAKNALYSSAEQCFTKTTLLQELDRVFIAPSAKKACGHPVDYMVEVDDERTREATIRILMQALYEAGRIDNKRYCEIELEPDRRFNKTGMEMLYRSCIGGTIVLSFASDKEEDFDEVHGNYSSAEDFCEIMRRHCREVLTIICLPRECTVLKRLITVNAGNCTFVEITEDMAADEEAKDFLKKRAKEWKVRTDKALFSNIEEGHNYLVPELNEIFDEWYNKKLKTTIYKQYKDFDGAKKKIKKEKPKGSAYEELESMIGLSSAKGVIHKALDAYKAQELYKDKGMTKDAACNHMIFTGNPGTAKTTVARICARILRDNNVLARGHMVEVGRGDLVGKYVGWTAPTIKRKFRDAKGGILFIDEAYSLVDDRDGSFGDEAINTIVQEMENNREEVIVIFAGYPDKMEEFLRKNPGLRSRIAHHVHFEDYDTEELCQIAEHIAKQKGLILDKGALEKLRGIMDKARKQPDFGNGRYVRNVIEKARLSQSSRLVRMDYDSVTPDDVKRICAEDIELPETGSKLANRGIGFAVA